MDQGGELKLNSDFKCQTANLTSRLLEHNETGTLKFRHQGSDPFVFTT